MALASNLVQIGINSKEADFLGDTCSDTFTAAGTTQGTAAALTSSYTRVSTAVGGVSDGVILPTLIQAKNSFYVVYNVSGATINVYPGVGDNIGQAADDIPASILNLGTTIFFAFGTSRWVPFS